MLRRRRQTPAVRAALVAALRDQANFAEMLGHEDEELRLRREAYTVAASTDDLSPHELAGFALGLGTVLCGQGHFGQAIGVCEEALACADPNSELAVMAGMRASVALRRGGYVGRALKLARDTVRLIEPVAAPQKAVVEGVGRMRYAPNIPSPAGAAQARPLPP